MIKTRVNALSTCRISAILQTNAETGLLNCKKRNDSVHNNYVLRCSHMEFTYSLGRVDHYKISKKCCDLK